MGRYRGDGPSQKVYSEDERKATLELAAAVGVSAAAEHMGVDRKTVYRWINRYPQLWSDLRAGDPRATKHRITQSLEDLAERYAAAEHDLLDRVEQTLVKSANAKEAAALLKAMGSSRQAAIAGSRTISPEAEQHELTINVPALEQAMERLLNQGAPAPALPVRNEAAEA